MAKTLQPNRRLASTSGSGWRLLFSALAIACIAALVSAYAYSQTTADWSRGYIDVGVKQKGSASGWVWKSRHDRAESPLKFYVHLLRPASLAIGLVLLSIALLIQALALFAGGPLPQPRGAMRGAHQSLLLLGTILLLYWLFLFVPLK